MTIFVFTHPSIKGMSRLKTVHYKLLQMLVLQPMTYTFALILQARPTSQMLVYVYYLLPYYTADWLLLSFQG